MIGLFLGFAEGVPMAGCSLCFQYLLLFTGQVRKQAQASTMQIKAIAFSVYQNYHCIGSLEVVQQASGPCFLLESCCDVFELQTLRHDQLKRGT